MAEPPRKVVKVDSKSKVNLPNSVTTEEVQTSELLEKDLPLLSNIEQVTVSHYIIKLKFLMRLKIVEGSLIIFVKPTCETGDLPNEIILDCCSLEILNIWALDTEIHDNVQYGKDGWFNKNPIYELNYELSKWSLRIYGLSQTQFPSVILINYKTLPKTPSLYWRPTTPKCYQYDLENENNLCVYTAASPVNNRGLFPCQEPPSAMATWEAYIHVPQNFLALVTSDEPGIEVTADAEDKTHTFYSFTKHKLPMSTFAIVVGVFPTRLLNWILPTPTDEDANLLPVRLFSLCEEISLPKLIEPSQFVKNVLKSAHKFLGPHPFARLDFVIMPQYFHVFGFANPNMIFLSPTLLSGDETNGLLIYSRIAHEISHSWFGLAIGALDWAEEWLSEGFATFMEDILYKEAMAMEKMDTGEEIELKIKLRLHTLQQELGNELEGNDLKVLVPEKSNAQAQAQSCKNGLVPLKQFNHVHYLKGYFFLRHLSSIVGQEKFLIFLKSYVTKFNGCLVTSKDFLTFYYEKFEMQFRSFDAWELMESLEQKWFFSAKLPEPLNSTDILDFSVNLKLNQSFEELCDKNILRISSKLSASELILFFEKILIQFEHNTLPKSYEDLKQFLDFTPNAYNPEVMHRWYEILLKFYLANPGKQLGKDSTVHIKFIPEFLLKNPPMGVYLYGELMISENAVLQNLASNLYRLQCETLDFESKHVLEEMIF